jgi:hypothetical protein
MIEDPLPVIHDTQHITLWARKAEEYYLIARAAHLTDLWETAPILSNYAVEYYLKALFYRYDQQLLGMTQDPARSHSINSIDAEFLKIYKGHDTPKLWKSLRPMLPNAPVLDATLAETLDRMEVAVERIYGWFHNYRYPDSPSKGPRARIPNQPFGSDLNALDVLCLTFREFLYDGLKPSIPRGLPVGAAADLHPSLVNNTWKMELWFRQHTLLLDNNTVYHALKFAKAGVLPTHA